MQQFNQVTENYLKLRANLNIHGFAILQSHATFSGCEYIKKFIDNYPEENAEINYGGTEKRIWGSHSMDPVVQAFSALSDQVMGKVFNSQPKVKTVLAYSNYPIEAEEQLMLGRWHLDSLRKQYKLFCFLTRTEEQTGPLEVVPGTHGGFFKLRALVSGRYISFSDLRTTNRRYRSLDDRWVEEQAFKAGGSVPFLCEPGTLILVDTSAIHRARPCLKNHRYALCAYYDHF